MSLHPLIVRRIAALSAARHSGWILGALLVAGCGMVVAPDEVRQVGVIHYHGQPAVVGVPDTVRAGEAFGIAVQTYGDGCVSEGETEVAVDSLLAQVVPYDLVERRGTCPDVLRTFEHTATVQFDEAGVAEVRIVGKRMPGNEIVVVRRQVVVEEGS